MHDKYMNRCLELARLGLGTAAPNPIVGSVIVHQGKIIGEGYHKKSGEAHAEVNAINSVKNPRLLKESTLYVNLEPCAHFGKTPPCSKLIVEKKIPKVVIGCIDTFAKVAGKGIEMLKAGGCDVTTGILEKESRELNKRFFTFHEKKRPYIILKWAQSQDGFIDKIRNDKNDKAVWITNQPAKMLVHKWRSEEAAIMIGTNTAKLDNPQLNVREWTGENPIRIVIDKELRLNNNLHVFDNSTQTIVFTDKQKQAKSKTEYVQIDFNKDILNQIFNELYIREIQSLIIEGGEILLNSVIDSGLWDEARVFTGNKQFGKGINAPKINNTVVSKEMIGDSELKIIINQGN